MARSQCWTTVLHLCVLHLLFVQICHRAESDRSVTEDDKLISLLLDKLEKKTDAEGSQVSQILKAIEAAENGTSTPKAVSSSKISSRVGEDPDYDEVIEFLEKSVREAHGIDENGHKVDPAAKRSDYHHHDPPFEKLLWGTARAVWDVSRPVFYRTAAGRKLSIIKDTVTLPIRTLGWIKRGILDLKTNPDRLKLPRSHYHHHHDDHHAHYDPWGWSDSPVFVKYEPDNSLFKSWVRYLYRGLRPAARLTRRLLIAKLRALGFIIRKIIKRKLRPGVLVLKEAPKGWHSGWSGWPSVKTTPAPRGWFSKWNIFSSLLRTTTTPARVKSGWSSGSWMSGPPPGWKTAATPKPSYGAPPPKYSAPTSYSIPTLPKYAAPPSQGYSSSIPEIIYGPPAETPAGYERYTYQHATPPSPPAPPAPTAYSSDYSYRTHSGSDPSQILTAPSDHHLSEVELPSYAKYLRQLGIDHTNLESLDSIRSMRQSEKEEDVPYLISESSDSSSASSSNNEDVKDKKEE
ncbi:hypothetical protein Ocin01_03823, partial [Orchesella cincta]